MIWWRFRRYHTADGRDLVRRWYDAQNEQVQSAFGTMIDLLELTEDWFTPPKHARILERRHAGLCEVFIEVRRYETDQQGRKKLRKDHYRPVGFIKRMPRRLGEVIEPGEFVLLRSCKKTGGVYEHVAAFDCALKLKQAHDEGRGTLHDHFL